MKLVSSKRITLKGKRGAQQALENVSFPCRHLGTISEPLLVPHVRRMPPRSSPSTGDTDPQKDILNSGLAAVTVN